MAAEQKQVRRFLQLDRRYARTKPTLVRTAATKLVSNAMIVRTPLAISHAATHRHTVHNISVHVTKHNCGILHYTKQKYLLISDNNNCLDIDLWKETNLHNSIPL